MGKDCPQFRSHLSNVFIWKCTASAPFKNQLLALQRESLKRSFFVFDCILVNGIAIPPIEDMSQKKLAAVWKLRSGESDTLHDSD